MIIKCSLCGVEYKQTYNWGEGIIEVAPHRCDLIEVPFVERVCNNGCDSLIRCRRDGFECREAWEPPQSNLKVVEGDHIQATESSSDQSKGDWQGGHELYVKGDR